MKPLYEESISKFCNLLDEEVERIEKQEEAKKFLKEQSEFFKKASEALPANPDANFLKLWRESINKPLN